LPVAGLPRLLGVAFFIDLFIIKCGTLNRPEKQATRRRACSVATGLAQACVASTKEHKPDASQNNERKAEAHYQQHKNARAGFGLPRLGRCFDDYTVLFNRDGTLIPD
jgi:hypothetical protein